MRLGLYLGGELASNLTGALSVAQEADRLGYHSAWVSESYGADAVSTIAWLLARTKHLHGGTAVMQVAARTPAATAMTAATLDILSEGRFLLGLGVSGPQVVEGWHGQPFGRPLERTREYVSVIRSMMAREAGVEFHGSHYDVPYSSKNATGLGKPLKLMIRPPSPSLPIYLAALGSRNVELTAELADGWLPLFFSPSAAGQVWRKHLDRGFLRSNEPGKRARFDIAAFVSILEGGDVQMLADRLKPTIALYVGGMGAPGTNFYNELACKFGYERSARVIQGLYLDGKPREAAAAVPDGLVDDIALLGSRERIVDRVAAWREAGVTTLVISQPTLATTRLMAELIL